MLWAIAASTGLAALLAASETAFGVLKLAGAAYLVLLGLQALRDAVRGTHEAGDLRPGMPSGGRASYRQGLVSNLGNPKMAVFFAGLLPQFAGSGPASLLTMPALGALFAVLTFAWLALYTVLITRARDVLRRPIVRRALDAVTGTALVALGLRLASDGRT